MTTSRLPDHFNHSRSLAGKGSLRCGDDMHILMTVNNDGFLECYAYLHSLILPPNQSAPF